MTTTQIWMLCFVGVMVLLMLLSLIWNHMGKKNRASKAGENAETSKKAE